MAALVAVVLLSVSGCGGSGGGGYTVRAIFDDAANMIPGEDVKIEGVKVGVVGPVTPTPQQKAAVELDIENAGFQDFRADASCTIEPEALIGEKFVNCLPTQPRAEGTPLPPPLHKIPSGHEGEGQYLLPVTNTSSPVDIDLLGDINRLPVRERFTIIINELGAGLAGRGSDLNVVVRRAGPGAARTRQGARHPRRPEQGAREPGRRVRPRARAGRRASKTRSRTSSSGPTRSPGPRPTSAVRSRATSRDSRRSWNSSGRRWNGSGASPNRRRRRSPTSKRRRRGSTRRSRSSRRSPAARRRSSRASARRPSSAGRRSRRCSRCWRV